MKCFYLPLLLLWLVPVVIAQMASSFMSASSVPPLNEPPRLRFLLQTNDASCTVEIAADGAISGLFSFEEDRWTKQK
jgi:hypothetical protein